MTSQLAVAAAVQVQSRFVETVSVADIPLAGASPLNSFSTLTVHLTSVGDVVESDDDEPVHAPAREHKTAIANSRAPTAGCESAIRLPSQYPA